MINLFRKKRQNQLIENMSGKQEGKTSKPEFNKGKYFKYAFGEIILVVIGILIAMQVNNANENRKDTIKVDKFLTKLKSQIQRNIETIKWQQEQNKEFIHISERLMPLLNTNSEENIEAKLDTLILVSAFDYNLNLDMLSLSEARNNGNLDLVKSDSLTLKIYQFIKLYDDIREREKITNEDLSMNFKPYLNKHYNVRNLIYMNGYPELKKSTFNQKRNVKILSDQVFENLLVTRILYAIEMYEAYQELMVLLKKINTELKLISND